MAFAIIENETRLIRCKHRRDSHGRSGRASAPMDCRTSSRCRYVVTPNVDHAVMLREHEGMRQSYGEADLILADGVPIVWASRLLQKPLPERVPGSELVPALFDSCDSSGAESDES